MPTLLTEPVAQAIREHQVQVAADWEYRPLAEELHRWVERFNADFHLSVPTPVIAIGRLPRNVLGRYRLGRNEIGARTTITLNERWLRVRPFADTLITLVHELVHARDEWHLGRTRGGWYHIAAFRQKMADIGIIADERGHTLEVLPRFTEYLNHYGVSDISFVPQVSTHQQRAGTILPKWVCGCPAGTVYVGDPPRQLRLSAGRPARAIHMNARCQDCGQLYRQAPF